MADLLLSREGTAAIISFHRPERLNAVDSAMLDQLDRAITDLADDAAVRVVILTGTGRAFMAGADIKELHTADSARAMAFNKRGSAILRRLELLPQPVIAAVNGYALGAGLELALAADLRVAAADAVFAAPETNLGQIPGFGGTQRLPRLIGPGRAKEIIFTGRRVGAEEALRIGLVERVVPPEALMEASLALAQEMCRASAFALTSAKRAINEGLDRPLDDALGLECELTGPCHDTPEQKERTLAFLKR